MMNRLAFALFLPLAFGALAAYAESDFYRLMQEMHDCMESLLDSTKTCPSDTLRNQIQDVMQSLDLAKVSATDSNHDEARRQADEKKKFFRYSDKDSDFNYVASEINLFDLIYTNPLSRSVFEMIVNDFYYHSSYLAIETIEKKENFLYIRLHMADMEDGSLNDYYAYICVQEHRFWACRIKEK
jgi:hypothetical protein